MYVDLHLKETKKGITDESIIDLETTLELPQDLDVAVNVIHF